MASTELGGRVGSWVWLVFWWGGGAAGVRLKVGVVAVSGPSLSGFPSGQSRDKAPSLGSCCWPARLLLLSTDCAFIRRIEKWGGFDWLDFRWLRFTVTSGFGMCNHQL